MNNFKNMNILRGTVAALILALLVACSGEGGSSSTAAAGGGTGIAGSTARMVVVDGFLYAIAENKLQLFTVDTPQVPSPWATVTVDWDIQTLFPCEDYLLVRAADGMHILDNTDVANPMLVGDLTHARTLDPVVANAGYAYVTLKKDPLIDNTDLAVTVMPYMP